MPIHFFGSDLRKAMTNVKSTLARLTNNNCPLTGKLNNTT